MRVLFTVSSWPSHYFSLVPLAWALRAAGHEVQVLCSLSEKDVLTGAGLTPVPVLEGVDMPAYVRVGNMMTAHVGAWPYPDPPPHPDTKELLDVSTFDVQERLEKWLASSGEQLHRNVDVAAEYMRSWRSDLVVYELMSSEGALAAGEAGVPSVLQLWGPCGPEDAIETLGGNNKGGIFSEATARSILAQVAGEDAADRAFARVANVVDVCPEPVAPSILGSRIPMSYVPYNGPGAVPLGLPARSGRPRVCVAWGRSASQQFGVVTNKIPQVIQAATELGAEVLLLASQADVEVCGPLPESVYPLVDVPLHLVLPGCDAVVHYAGAGVTMTSMVAGVPQLALPLTHNYAVLSRKFDRAGCGLSLLNYEADAQSIKGALASLLQEPSFRMVAADLAAQASRMPSPAAIVDTLEQIAAGSATGPAQPAAG